LEVGEVASLIISDTRGLQTLPSGQATVDIVPS
jgi:hypothetical protein